MSRNPGLKLELNNARMTAYTTKIWLSILLKGVHSAENAVGGQVNGLFVYFSSSSGLHKAQMILNLWNLPKEKISCECKPARDAVMSEY